jgi:hypothetical protein
MDYVPAADLLSGGRQYIVNGTLLPCWSWHPARTVNAVKTLAEQHIGEIEASRAAYDDRTTAG